VEYKDAEKLLGDLFDNKFNQGKFEEFTTELFNGFKPTMDNVPLWKEYNDYICSVDYLGLHINPDNQENLAIYTVKLKKDSSRDRARVMQRNLVGRILDSKKRDAALVAFYNEEQEDWRLSFVKVDYEIDTETIGVKKTFSSAKRYSYLTGPNEPNHSCKSRFLGFLIDESQTISISQMQDIFSVEKVTNEFFEKYNDLFKKLKESLDNVVKNDLNVKDEFEKKNIETSDFAKKLLGQIVFIYFLQKKGWLGVPYEEDYGNGSKTFLEDIYNQYKNNKNEHSNFFDNILEPLFYKALNVQRDRDYYEDLDCKIPFLNGGLFDTINDYDWIATSIKIDDKIFGEIIETFKRFNFTVKEDEPLEKEVAVDPEMLGKVFENLLESRDRKEKGAFYTPREIVHYICQKTLINYLKNNSETPEDTIVEFIEKGYKLIDILIRHQEDKKSGSSNPAWNNHLTIIKENSENLLKLLNDVKVIDPAVGSGAFPVGMMNEIVNAKTIICLLTSDTNEEIDTYDLKREIIENSLYGVDIEYFALDVAKLRFWLSLVVDEASVDEIKPLPNLDHKLMCGNSLIEEFDGVQLFDKTLLKGTSSQTDLNRFYNESQSVLDDLRRLQKKLFNEKNPNDKRDLKKEIDDKEWSLIEHTLSEKGNEESLNELKEYKKANSKPFFLWELYFSEIFQGDNQGFDIVIGNPPYVRQEKIKEFKPYFKDHYETYTGVADLYVYFFEKGINVLNKKGSLGFICSNKFTRANYGKKLRKFLLQYNITNYNDYTGEKVFESATVDSSVIVINKGADIENILINNDYFMSQSRLTDNSWSFEPPEILNLKDKILSKGTQIKDIKGIKINYGIKTGFNKAFIINEEIKDELIAKDSKNAEIIKPLLRGRDIKKWAIDFGNIYLIMTKNGIDVPNEYPVIYDYLKGYKDKLSKRYDQGDYWYNLRSCSYYEEFEKPKLVWQRVTKDLIFVNDDDKFIILDSCFILTSDKINLKFLKTLLTSKMLKFVFSIFGALLGKKGFYLAEIYVEQLPIILPPENQKKPLINLADKMIELNKNLNEEFKSFYNYLNTENASNINKKLTNYYELTFNELHKEVKKQSKLINENILEEKFNKSIEYVKKLQNEIENLDGDINKLVYELYDLTDDEIGIIEEITNNFKG